MNHEHDWQISVILPVGYPSDRPIPMDAPTVTYCTSCKAVFNGDMNDDPDEWHLVIEDDEGKPFLSGCDCALGRDHYDTEAAA